MPRAKLNNIYRDIKARCYNPNSKAYKNYGGRGIKMCDEWFDSEIIYTNLGRWSKGWLRFKEWAISSGYKEGLTIDRIDNNKGYSPSNCRWVTMKEQANNKRNNYIVSYKGEVKTLHQWCDALGLNYSVTWNRIKRDGLSIEQAFEK